MLGSKCMLIFSVVLLLISPVVTSAENTSGDRFVTVMDGNTLSGTSLAGLAFNLYFLAAGQVTYVTVAGQRVEGTWHLDSNDDVCIEWPRRVEAMEGCFQISIDGDRIVWRNRAASRHGVLRGGVTNQFLNPAP